MKLTKSQKLKLKKVAEKYNLKLVILFGSFASGTNRPDSDFDVAVEIREKLDFKKEMKMMGDLIDTFSRDIDMVIINNANPLLLSQISKNGILLYGRREDYARFRLKAFHRYNDYRPFFKMEAEFVKRWVAEMNIA